MGRFKKVDGIPTIAMPRVRQAVLVRGAVGCGKTGRLVERARALLAQGVSASEALVLCATPDASRRFAERLGVPGVRVCTPRQLALELLALPEACRLFGHGPRVLLPYEEDILFEDLKVSGLEVDRVRGMLSFFRRSMTEIADDHPDFIMDDDERGVMDLLRRGLALRGAYIEEQVCANAARFLNTAGAGIRYAHVLVDDFQLLCRASQVMAGLLATESVCAAADPDALDPASDPYPHAAGVRELLDANPHAEVVELDAFGGSAAVRRAVNALRAQAGLGPCGAMAGAPDGFVLVETLHDPDAEIERAAELVADAIGGGIAPADVFVASPAPRWDEGVARALRGRGIAAASVRNWSALLESDADPSADAEYLRMVTALLLAGDATDDAAWRSWCAFGDPLAASREVDAVAGLAEDGGARLHEALDRLSGIAGDGAAPGAPQEVARVLDAYRQGRGLIENTRGLARDTLLQALADAVRGGGGPVPEQILALCEGAPEEAGARELRRLILDRAAEPLWDDAPADAVRIGRMGGLCGLSPKLVVLVGFVNGFFPKHGFFDETVTPPGRVEAARAADARTLCAAVGKARDGIVCTAFTKIPCADAEHLGLKIDRIALERRVRTARVSPSIFCEALLPLVP